MVRLTTPGVTADKEDVGRLHSEFQETGWVLLPNLLEPRLLDFVLNWIDQGQWQEHVRESFDCNCILDACPAVDLLHFVTNRPAFLDVVHEITGSGPFTWFGGLVYRMVPDAGHYDEWHTDNTDGRLIAFSLNLSPRGYQGGRLQLRGRGSDRVFAEIANTGLGDAILFRISENLLHRVTQVEGTEPKTAFAGWFNGSAPTFADRLRSLARQDRVAPAGGI